MQEVPRQQWSTRRAVRGCAGSGGSTSQNGQVVHLTYALWDANQQPAYQKSIDQFEQLHDDAAASARIMALVVHPYIMGAPHRLKYFRRIFKEIRKKPDVLFWTGGQIAESNLIAVRELKYVPLWVF